MKNTFWMLAAMLPLFLTGCVFGRGYHDHNDRGYHHSNYGHHSQSSHENHDR